MTSELLCGYRGKCCPNPRAVKPSGGLHSLCKEHRRKANDNQRRLQQRNRQERLWAMRQAFPTDKEFDDWLNDNLQPLEEPYQFTEEDIAELEELFCSDEQGRKKY